VLERMREGGFNVGGEQSGHLILSDYSTTGDGLVTAMQVLAEVQRKHQRVSEVCRRFEPAPQVLRNVRAARDQLEKEAVTRIIAAAHERLGATGRLVIRPSGTEPVIRVMGEGDNRELVEEIVSEVCHALRDAAIAA
jgi:phosphoglucosamine mutase